MVWNTPSPVRCRRTRFIPSLALKAAGGYLVWEDNITDGDGLGISALQLDADFSGVFSPFRVNFGGTDDQERPQVSLLNGGGAAFVWQGGRQGFQRIYARFLSAAGTWTGNDVLVNTFTTNSQVNPTVATLANGNVVVAWGSYNQFSANSMQDVYAQLLSPGGQKVGGEFLVNAFTAFNQRTPAVASLERRRFRGGLGLRAATGYRRCGSAQRRCLRPALQCERRGRKR